MKQTDEFTRLVENMVSGKLSLNLVQIAIKSYVKRSENIPEGVKNLLCGTEGHASLISMQFKPIASLIGSMELAYRRGVQEGLDQAPAEKEEVCERPEGESPKCGECRRYKEYSYCPWCGTPIKETK